MFLHFIGDYVTDDYDQIHTLTVCYKQQYEATATDNGQRIGVDLACVGDLPILIRGGYDECANALLDSIRTRASDVATLNYRALPIAINQASNTIARLTRRGAGNTIYAPFSTIDSLLQEKYLNERYSLISATEIKPHEIIIAYRRPIGGEYTISDCSVFIKKMGDEYEVRTLEKWLDYYHTVRIDHV